MQGMRKMKRVYMDHAATTPVRKEVLKEMLPYFSKKYGNASSLHSFGKEAREAVENARKKIAKIINADPEEIIFTSGGTESDNLAIKGAVKANPSKNMVIMTKIEHDAVLNTGKELEKSGMKVKYLNVSSEGIVNVKYLENEITANTLLVSVMHANNEIGTIQPISEIGEICRQKGVLFHTDAVQTFCKERIDVKKMNIDLLSASAHKIYGPKGIGFLYVKKETKLKPLFSGGGHEFGIRSGTENLPGIIGFAKAAELAAKEMNSENKRLAKLRDMLISSLLKVEETKLNGSAVKRLANNVNISFYGIEGEGIILNLNSKGIAASTGSACSSKSLEPSHVLLALGMSHLEAHGSVRLTLGKSTTEKEIKYVSSVIPKVIKNLRRISPFSKC